MTLSAAEFPAFYRAVNGYDPFPWQTRLVKEVAANGGLWPAVLDLPTSAGKTSALDAAVFLLALQAGVSVHERKAAIRTFFVVDRRIVVDEAADKARKLARLLNVADDTPDAPARLQVIAREQRRIKPKEPDPLAPNDIALLQAVAARLRQFGGGEALHVSVLRGGMYRDGSWAESPTQPTICLSTVDQVGSRLLFRGYGVSPYQRAVHAGLVGNDALLLVDEAHLSRPFLETLKAVEFYRSYRWAERPVPTPFQVVVMSATAGSAAVDIVPPAKPVPGPITLHQSDRDHPLLKARLAASKIARLESVSYGSDNEEKNRQEFAEAVATFARQLAAAPGADPNQPVRVVGVVVNRVDTARRVFRDLLARRNADAPDFDAILLTGRIRPYDRDRLLDRWFKYMAADKDRPLPPSGRLFVVATQTVEVGANLSFDALVTEGAPLDALRQRFGRLDRLGLRVTSHAVIAARKDLLKVEDPVYGKAMKATWDWLGKHVAAPKKDEAVWDWLRRNSIDPKKYKSVDFGIDALAKILPADLAPLCAPFACAPVMMPAHVDDWVQTSVAPEPDPDPALFLHGPQSGPADVSVVWRADLSKELLAGDLGKPDAAVSGQVVALVPPTSMEAMSLPIWHVRNWLRDRAKVRADFTDLEGEPEPDAGRNRDDRESDPFLIWKGPDRPDRTKSKERRKDRARTRASDDPDDISPGNTIVVPASYGGCDEFGWNPEHSAGVCDVADDCSWRAKRRPVLRVHRGSQVHSEAIAAWQRLSTPFPSEVIELLPSLLVIDPDTGETDWDEVARGFRKAPGKFAWLRNARRVVYPDGAGLVLSGRMRESHPDYVNDADTNDEAPADDEGNTFLGTDDWVWLEDHCRNVQARVEAFASVLALSDSLRDSVSRAALLHDAGKSDPRFQSWLYGSDAEAARTEFRLIAKSRTEGRNAAAVEAARKRAGWPKGGRHEAASVLLARSSADVLAGLHDPELLEYLIGSHHGRGRPLWPFTEDDAKYEASGAVSVELANFALHAELPTRPESALSPLHAGWVDLFWRLVRRYGYWGLAYLETLLVLADHRQSEAERDEEPA